MQSSVERRSDSEPVVPFLDSKDIHFLHPVVTDVNSLSKTHEERSPKAMVIDDDPLSTLAITTMLSQAGFEVGSASSAEDYLCLYAASTGRDDVLITDINMPGGMSGFDLLTHMRNVDSSLSVVVMTAEDEYENVRKALELGAQGYIGKPFRQPTDVVQTVKTAAVATRMVRENVKLLERLNYQNNLLLVMSVTDALTDVFNRRHIDAVLEAQRARSLAHALPLSVVMFDIDDFKSFNDEYGHLVGDDVLVHVADIVKNAIRSQDDIGRYGGEEFILILPDTPPADAESMARRIRKTIEAAPLRVGDLVLTVTASFGVSGSNNMCLEQADHDMLKLADIAMYSAKEAGKNRVVTKAHRPD